MELGLFIWPSLYGLHGLYGLVENGENVVTI